MSVGPNPFPLDLRWLNTDEVAPNDRNPRLVFPQAELDLLAESIDQIGIQVPLLVYEKDGKYVLVDGERRLRCAQVLGLSEVPAVITNEKSDLELLQLMFNVHLIREPWQDMPTAKALNDLSERIESTTGKEPTDNELVLQTGLSLERVRRLRYVVTLPRDWQEYIETGRIPLNFFWELKRSVIDPLANLRPDLLKELDEDRVMRAFVQKRLDEIIKDAVSLRDVASIIRFSARAASEGGPTASRLDDSIRDLVENHETTIDDVYEDAVQTMVAVDKLERRTASMVAAFTRLLSTAPAEEDRVKIRAIGNRLVQQLQLLIGDGSGRDEQAI